MPYRNPDPQDPHELVAVSLPGDVGSVREMAATFAEEFAALGFDEDRLLDLFRRPGYTAAHRAYEVLGEEEIRRLIAESLALWGRVRFVVRETSPERLVQIGTGQIGTETRPPASEE